MRSGNQAAPCAGAHAVPSRREEQAVAAEAAAAGPGALTRAGARRAGCDIVATTAPSVPAAPLPAGRDSGPRPAQG